MFHKTLPKIVISNKLWLQKLNFVLIFYLFIIIHYISSIYNLKCIHRYDIIALIYIGVGPLFKKNYRQ